LRRVCGTHADEREAHIREVERFGQTLPEGSYGRQNRQAIAARETRIVKTPVLLEPERGRARACCHLALARTTGSAWRERGLMVLADAPGASGSGSPQGDPPGSRHGRGCGSSP